MNYEFECHYIKRDKSLYRLLSLFYFNHQKDQTQNYNSKLIIHNS